jgi:hypothetical protein
MMAVVNIKAERADIQALWSNLDSASLQVNVSVLLLSFITISL